MLILDQVYHHYAHHPVIDGISLTLAPGQTICITGPSGCGKTTLLRIAAGLLVPIAGKVINQFARIGYVFQDPQLLPWKTAQENLAFGLKARNVPKPERDRIVAYLAQTLGLTSCMHRFPHQLSGGMQQRVALGRALAIDPDILLLDEPFSGLDVGRKREFQGVLRQLLQERHLATCFVTHDLVEAMRLGDRILVLSPSPSRIVHQWHAPPTNQRASSPRDEADIYRQVSQLLAVHQVSRCFGLENQASYFNKESIP